MFEYKSRFAVHSFFLTLCTITLLIALITFVLGVTVGKVGVLKDNLGVILTFICGLITAVLTVFGSTYVLIEKQKSKALEKHQEEFKRLHSFYLNRSKKYSLEVANVYSLLGYWTEPIYIHGVRYEWPVTNVTVPDNYPEPPVEVQAEFELAYPVLYQKYELLQNHKDSLEKINNGAHDEKGLLTEEARQDIERYYDYFYEIKNELDAAFDVKAKELRLR